MVARLEPENHTDYIVETYCKLDTDIPLVVVGDTNYESDYIRGLRGCGDDRVRFLGGVYEGHVLESLLHHSLLYIHGHSVGGTNPVLLQAMACSCAIAYLDVSFNEEVIGGIGDPFGLGDDRLSQLFNQSVANPSQLDVSRELSKERVEEKYTWVKATDSYEAMCRSLNR